MGLIEVGGNVIGILDVVAVGTEVSFTDGTLDGEIEGDIDGL